MCDPARPGFDKTHFAGDTRSAAQHSQCIHTNSKGHGTENRDCDQNWLLGNCGESQSAAK